MTGYPTKFAEWQKLKDMVISTNDDTARVTSSDRNDGG
jgi:hypothetical protein